MSTYILPDVRLASGTLRVTYENDNGFGDTINLEGEFLENISQQKDDVEDEGIGGIPLIGSINFEYYDQGNVFVDSIFNSGTVSRCFVKVNMDVAGTESNVFFGTVELSTVEYPSIYDDESGTEEHTVKFMAVSILGGLRSVSMDTLRQYLYDNHMVPASLASLNLVNVGNVFTSAFRYLDVNRGITVSYNFRQKYFYNGITTAEYPNESYFYFYATGVDEHYVDLWSDTYSNSFMSAGNVYAFIEKLCSNLLVYPVISYDSETDTFSVYLTHRHTNVYISPTGGLISSVLSNFYGYDAIRVTNVDSVPVHVTDTEDVSGYDRRIYPRQRANTNYILGISDNEFDVVQHKFDFRNFIGSAGNTSLLMPSYTFYLIHSNLAYGHGYVYDVYGSESFPEYYTSFNVWLLQMFIAYWGSSKKMYTRTYTGIGVSWQLMNMLEIDGVAYTVFSITRNFVENTVTLKCIEY